MVDVPGVDAADVHRRFVEVPEEQVDLRQIVLEFRDPPLPQPRLRVELLREASDHRDLGLPRRPDVVPDSIDDRPLIVVDERVQGLEESPDRRGNPDRLRAVNLPLHRSARGAVAAGPDRQVEASLDAQVHGRHAAQVLRIVVRDRTLRPEFPTMRPDVLDEVRAADLLLAFREDLQVHGHLVDVPDRLPREQMIREGPLGIGRTPGDDRSPNRRDVVDLRCERWGLPCGEVADGLDVVHLVLHEGDGGAHVKVPDHQGMAALRP